MRKHGGTPSWRDKQVTLAAISPPGDARGRFVGGQQSGLAGCKPPPLFTRGASSCSSQGPSQGEPWGASPRPSAPTYLPTYMVTSPRGHPCPAWDDLISTFYDHGIFPDDTWQEIRQKTHGRNYRRRVRARLLELLDPLCHRWDDLRLDLLGPWLTPSHLPHTCQLCGECDTVSSAAPTGANRCAQCSQVAACPWPEPPAGPHRRTEEEALHGRITGAHAPSHERAYPQAPPSWGSKCTCGTPRPSRTCRTYSSPDPHPPPRFAEPAAPCLADGGTGRGTPEPAAERSRRPSEV